MIIKLLSLVRKHALVLFLLYVIAITALSLASLGDLPETAPESSDKFLHFAAYALFVLLCFNYLESVLKNRILFYAILFSMIYGTIIEIIQHKINPERNFDPLDILANSFGIAFGDLLIRYYKDKVKIE